MSKVIKGNDQNFEEEVFKSNVPVLVDFYTDYCGPCQRLKPILEELAEELSGRAKIVTVDVMANEHLATHFSISAVPTLIVVKNGQVVCRMVGLQSKANILEALNQ